VARKDLFVQETLFCDNGGKGKPEAVCQNERGFFSFWGAKATLSVEKDGHCQPKTSESLFGRKSLSRGDCN